MLGKGYTSLELEMEKMELIFGLLAQLFEDQWNILLGKAFCHLFCQSCQLFSNGQFLTALFAAAWRKERRQTAFSGHPESNAS